MPHILRINEQKLWNCPIVIDRGNWVVLVIHRPEQAKEPIIYLQPISETSELE